MSSHAPNGEEPRYVLLTQCLQNDFFLNRDCRLSLPDHVVRQMLLAGRDCEHDFGSGSRRRIPNHILHRGPLGLFLDAAIGRRLRGVECRGTLHVINICDWHVDDDAYDAERRSYGPHCEKGTWGARYVDGLERYLDPAGDGRLYAEGTLRVEHVRSDSLFDFKPRATEVEGGAHKFTPSKLESLLDDIVQESDCVYVAVIGVYTDIKVKTLLTGLRTRYNLTNLAVSDTFTGSTMLERHLAGLDFARRVLDTEVIHGVNDLVRFLGGSADLDNEADVVTTDSYARYQSFFQNQQNVLAYQHERLQEYKLLTERRSVKVYETIELSNRFLLLWGGIFLLTTLVLSVLAAFGTVRWEISAVTGGLSLAQFVGVFFRTSGEDLQQNLTNLAVFKMILESHSLKVALARFHLTTPPTLRELDTAPSLKAAKQQIDALDAELRVIQGFDKADFDDLERLGFRSASTILPQVAEAAAANHDSSG